MSAEAEAEGSSSPQQSSSNISIPESEADEIAEAGVVQLIDITTLSKLYKSKVLKAPSAKNIKFPPDPELLGRVSLFQGDITKLNVDAIVNAANRSLLGGGGVDGAIHDAAGPKLLDECRSLNGCLTGQSKITRGYDLPARHIIHSVGPMYSAKERDEKAELLASCYSTSLEVAVENGLRHAAFPSISTGVYGYPIEDATRVALNAVRLFIDSKDGPKLERVIFVVWSDKDKLVYESLIPEYFPPGEKPEPPPPVVTDSEP